MISDDVKEQKAIAEALSDIDELIEIIKSEINKQENLKRGVLEAYFSSDKSGYTFRLGDLGFFYGGLSGKTGSDFGTGNATFITFLNVINNVIANKDDKKSIFSLLIY